MSKKTREKCSACGTSPVNHQLLFISNFLDETIGKLDSNFTKSPTSKKWTDFSFFIEKTLARGLHFIGALRYGKDLEKANTGRSKLIWEEAVRRNIAMEQFVVFGKYIELYRAEINGKTYHFSSLPIPPWLAQSGYDWLDDKFVLFEKLSAGSVPVPKAEKISSWAKAKNAFLKLEKPVILKPKSGSRSRHTTTNIKTEEELKNAFNLAKKITLWTVMQEHLFGSVYRATVINGELVGFFKADPPQIAGDGLKTIKELIVEKNKNRPERISEILINDDLVHFIGRLGYNLESVLPKGIKIDLSAKTGRMYGGYTREMLKDVHPKLISILNKAGNIVEAPVAGFDLIIEDPTKDPDTQKWGIIECNSLPFIDLHYFAYEGEPVNLAKNVWDLWNIKK